MLKKLRDKKTSKKVFIVLAAIIIPPFVFWGAGSLLRNKEDADYAGRIFGRNISLMDYRDALQATRNQMILQFGDKLEELSKLINLQEQAWERLILLHEARLRRLTASDVEVVALIEKYPFFQYDGKFNSKLYNERLQFDLHTQPRLFEEEVRENLIITKLFNQVAKDLTVTDDEIKLEYVRENEEVSISYIAGLPADFLKDITPSEAELKDYFSANSLAFKQPPSYSIEYVAADSEEKIKGLASRIRKNSDFAKLAKEAGLTVKESGLFAQSDPIPGVGWSPEILSLLSKLKIGQYTTALRVDKSFYILRLKEKKDAHIPKYELIKDKVREAFIKVRSEQLAKAKIIECQKKLNQDLKVNPKGIDLTVIAKEFGLKSDSTDLFKFGSYIKGVGASDPFWVAARALKDDQISNVLETPNGYYLIRVKSRVPIDEKEFEKEKAQFGKKVLQQKKEESFGRFLEELKRKAV